jgi:hypothetical protein
MSLPTLLHVYPRILLLSSCPPLFLFLPIFFLRSIINLSWYAAP